MSVFTARKLKEMRLGAHISQDEAAKKLKMSERKLRSIEAEQTPVFVDDLVEFAKLYNVDIRELIYESYLKEEEERILFNRYASVFKLYDKLSDKNKEDVYRVLKEYVRRMD